MSEKHEVERQRERQTEPEIEQDSEVIKAEQERQREEVGTEILNRILEMIYEKYPEMDGIEPIIKDESVKAVADNILARLKELKTTDTEIDEFEKAWKSLLFKKDVYVDQITMTRVIIAIINRRGELMRVDETMG